MRRGLCRQAHAALQARPMRPAMLLGRISCVTAAASNCGASTRQIFAWLQGEVRMPGKPTIGWIGMGRMGYPMAERLLKAGYDVSIWNRTRSKAEPLAKFRGKVGDNPLDPK